MNFDTIVIGAGAAGLSFTALMEQKYKNTGKTIALLEAHALSGGCASYFERQGFLFDAGATTLSGLKEGRPLSNLIKELNLDLQLIKIDPGIVSLFGDKKVRHYADEKKWIAELNEKFPGIDNEKIWNKIFSVSHNGWKLSTDFPELPLASWSEVTRFLKTETLSALKILPSLLASVEDALQLKTIHDEEYKSLINEVLFITAQNETKDTPMLMGAMGLTYTDDTYYVLGGMKAFATALEKKCSNLFLKHKVLSIKKSKEGFIVVTNRETFTCKELISTLPEWNHNDLFNQKLFSEKSSEACWSAFMLYMTIPVDKTREGLYFQIHCDPVPFCGSKSFFVSLSHPEDLLRSGNRQTVTISCHTKPQDWEFLTPEEYKDRKKIAEEFILTLFCERFQLNRNDLANVFTGSPKTFVKYTHRYRGLVGGIPHSLKRNPLTYLKSRSPYKNFYLIGDTQFPGQGIAAVVLGAQNLARKMK